MSAKVHRLPPSDLQKLEAVLRYPGTYAEAETIPKKATGRPRAYPDYMLIVYQAAVSIWGTARKVEAQLADPRVWRFMRHTVKAIFPSDPSKWLPEKPMRRSHYLYGRSHYLADPDVLERRHEVFVEGALALAGRLGLLDPDGPGSFTRPHLSRMLHGDGKVTASQVKGRRGETRKNANGEDVPVRYDPDAADHLEGGSSEPTYGTKWLTVSARSDEGRVVIDTRYVPFGGEGGEAGVAVSAFARIAPKAPGVLGVIWDGALRGVHIDRIMRELGWLTIAPVAAKSRDVRRGGKGGLRVPKSREIEVKTVERRPGEVVPVPLYAVDGRLGLGELNDRGETAFVPLERIRTQRMADKRGFRFYNQYRMPQGYTTREITVRLHNSPKDGKLNRAENLRAIPYGDPDRRDLYLRRKDAESLNDVLERSLYLKKAHSIGRWRQESDLLGFGLLMNAQTLAQALARERIERAAA